MYEQCTAVRCRWNKANNCFSVTRWSRNTNIQIISLVILVTFRKGRWWQQSSVWLPASLSKLLSFSLLSSSSCGFILFSRSNSVIILSFLLLLHLITVLSSFLLLLRWLLFIWLLQILWRAVRCLFCVITYSRGGLMAKWDPFWVFVSVPQSLEETEGGGAGNDGPD